ncbi:unnamed protein product [Orchesella dallaii]|uniref:Uncharacterized protein n=1 Tax=Orchesella dallaii TaxID=48710 RepID=A0ABP1Q1S3_9HEXA
MARAQRQWMMIKDLVGKRLKPTGDLMGVDKKVDNNEAKLPHWEHGGKLQTLAKKNQMDMFGNMDEEEPTDVLSITFVFYVLTKVQGSPSKAIFKSRRKLRAL